MCPATLRLVALPCAFGESEFVMAIFVIYIGEVLEPCVVVAGVVVVRVSWVGVVM